MRTTPTTTKQPLLDPVALGDIHLPNRVVMAPTTRARVANDDGVPTHLHAAYYAQRSSAGLIITEGTWVSERAIGFVHVPGVYREDHVAAWRTVTDLVHALGGRIVLQLWHCGSASHPDHHGGELPAGPSAINPGERSFTRAGFLETVTPREMTGADIEQAVTDFGAAAANARRVGFDGVEVQAIGSCLITQFLNPLLNRRADAFGGDRVGRRRLLLEILAAVADSWDGRRVGLRLSPYWAQAGESTLAEFDELVRVLNDLPLAYLHLRGPDVAAPRVPDLAALQRYRRLFDGPMIANNGFDRASGNAAIEAGVADAVSYARLFIANPDLVTRFATGHEPATGDPATFYTGGAGGYVDYPYIDWCA